MIYNLEELVELGYEQQYLTSLKNGEKIAFDLEGVKCSLICLVKEEAHPEFELSQEKIDDGTPVMISLDQENSSIDSATTRIGIK